MQLWTSVKRVPARPNLDISGQVDGPIFVNFMRTSFTDNPLRFQTTRTNIVCSYMSSVAKTALPVTYFLQESHCLFFAKFACNVIHVIGINNLWWHTWPEKCYGRSRQIAFLSKNFLPIGCEKNCCSHGNTCMLCIVNIEILIDSHIWNILKCTKVIFESEVRLTSRGRGWVWSAYVDVLAGYSTPEEK